MIEYIDNAITIVGFIVFAVLFFRIRKTIKEIEESQERIRRRFEK